MHKLILFLSFSFFLMSCEKVCSRQDKLLDTLDLRALKPQDKYNSQEFLEKKNNITFYSDSTAKLYYQENNTTYEFTYKVITNGTDVYEQEKNKN